MARPRHTPGRGGSRGGKSESGRASGRGGGGRRGGGRGGTGGRGSGPGWDNMALPLPRSTAARIGRRPGRDDNVGLWLDKLVYRQKADWTLKADARSFALGQLCEPQTVTAGALALTRRREALASKDMLAVELVATVNGRLLVDYGRANAMETTVSFHPIWGVPRIPGSALKGICRAALTPERARDELDAIFGAEVGDEHARAGQIAFHDGLPARGAFELALDVLTPHHVSYYRDEGKSPPGDWESPVPHTFVTVVNTTFVFHLSACFRGTDGPSKQMLKRWLEVAREGLITALEHEGVGAKTAAGYGRFTRMERRCVS